MPSSKIVFQKQFVDMNTGQKIELTEEEGNRFYAAVLKSGHCGIEYFIPVLRSAHTKDLETAIEFLESAPGVKRGYKCVIDSCDISRTEHKLICMLNNHDRYMNYYKDDEIVLEEIERRKILMENHEEVAWKDKKAESSM